MKRTPRTLWLLAGLVSLSACAAYGQVSPQRTQKVFPVFDATNYRNKPSRKALGLQRIYVLYAWRMWKDSQRDRNEPIEAQVRQAARKIPDDTLVCLDIENWSVKKSDQITHESIRKLKQVITWVRQEKPSVKLGYYGLMPVTEYWRSIQDPKSSKYQQWAAWNKRMEELAKHVDVIFPSLYTYYPDQRGWERYAIANIKQARRYGKPVYVFLWPQYHDSNKKIYAKGHWTSGFGYFDSAYWRRELELCAQHADGIVIWGGNKQRWNDAAGWWQETGRFLEVIRGELPLR